MVYINIVLFQIIRFEKYISGKYLGEFVRVVLAKLTEEGFLFIGEHTPGCLLVPGNLTSDLVSDIEQYVAWKQNLYDILFARTFLYM